MEKSIITFGEILLRLSAPGTRRFPQVKSFNAAFGGSEANVAASLASLGRHVQYISRVPKNDIGKACLMYLRQFNIGVDYMVQGGDRLGSYYMETAASMRNSKVVYDRDDSAYTTLQADMVDWDDAFVRAQWYQWSGIAAAMSESTAEACKVAMEKARKYGLHICCDINYRKNLWNYGKTYEEVMRPLLNLCDVVFGSEDEWEHILGLSAGSFKGIISTNGGYGYNEALCKEVAHKMKAAYPTIKLFTVEMRKIESSNHHVNGAFVFDGETLHYSRLYNIDHVVDCVGVGDAYVAALIDGLITYGGEPKQAMDFAMAASALKNTVPGDFNLVSRSEVMALLEGNMSGRVQR